MSRSFALFSWVPLASMALAATASAANCDKACLEKIGDQYRAAYLKHDRALAPFARKVRLTENNVEMEFPDGSWDTSARR